MKKLKYLKTKINIYYGSAALMTLISATSLVHAMDEPRDDEQKTVVSARVNNEGVDQSTEKKLFKRILNQDIEAQRLLAQCYMKKGRTMEAFILYKAAAKKGDVASANALGDLLSGEKKIKWHTIAAEAGHSESQLLVGNHYRDKGNLEAAEEWFTRAASQQNPGVQAALVALPKAYYDKGIEFLNTNNKPEAIRYFERAANKDLRDAQSKLGHLYLSEENFEKAVEYFKKAVAQNDSTAEDKCRLGALYLKNVKDHKSARELFEKAHVQGHLESTTRFAWMCYLGEGGEKDQRKAIDLWTEAATNGDGRARDKLVEIVQNNWNGSFVNFKMAYPSAEIVFPN